MADYETTVQGGGHHAAELRERAPHAPAQRRMAAYLPLLPSESPVRLLSLGYEHHDTRLSRLGESPVAALASADVRCEVVSGLLRLVRLGLSRRVLRTNPCTNQPFDLLEDREAASHPMAG